MAKESRTKDSNIHYWPVFIITWIIVFIFVWLKALDEWGFLLGIGFGWIPAVIAATLLAFLWPLIALFLILVLVIVIIVLATSS